MNSRPDRKAARLLVIDRDNRLLLFRFTPGDRPPFWATPGGALDPGESYEDGARRELAEETGILAEPGESIDSRTSEFTTFDGIAVRAVERYFAIRVEAPSIDTSGHTALERDVMREHRWWYAEELAATAEHYYPADLPALLDMLRETTQ
ncbi:NUDIX hydrolase [Parasphingopyxis marina]|uniref:NUDIX domain-containing protein n=1 Tax=Parasphingopyxis marina TaxID=2761622 RepID=A0A842I2D5_9SPHN|nr:NUDIX domain-containing protein [Parasphingopyxis marina]MBC2779011.1 NUDIX domain-containing protein [Parasphingopyxis marina]